MNIEKLPVDFEDDIINEDVNELRKYQMIQNTDGTVSFIDATDYLVTGSLFGAKEVVETNSTVNEIIEKSKFYGIKSLTTEGMEVESYQVSQDITQAAGYGYAWEEEIKVGEIINHYSHTPKINLQPNTAYRFKIKTNTAPFWGRDADYQIIDSFFDSVNGGADIKELYTYAETLSYTNDYIYVVVYNHCEHEVRLFNFSKISLKALSISDN